MPFCSISGKAYFFSPPMNAKLNSQCFTEENQAVVEAIAGSSHVWLIELTRKHCAKDPYPSVTRKK